MNKKYKGIGVLAFAAGSLLPGATANAADQNAARSQRWGGKEAQYYPDRL